MQRLRVAATSRDAALRAQQAAKMPVAAPAIEAPVEG
jgi:hypothetical protein